MKPYKALSGDSGVSAYEVGRNSVILEFKDTRTYVYNYRVPGMKKVEAMKKLAPKGRGLATFVNKHVRNRYAARLR